MLSGVLPGLALNSLRCVDVYT